MAARVPVDRAGSASLVASARTPQEAGAGAAWSGVTLVPAATDDARAVRADVLVATVVALLAFVVVQFTSVSRLATTLEHLSWQWILASTVPNVLFFAVYAWMYHYAFEAVDAPVPTIDLVPVVFAAMFAKTIVPLEGAGFAAVLVADAGRHGHPGARPLRSRSSVPPSTWSRPSRSSARPWYSSGCTARLPPTTWPARPSASR